MALIDANPPLGALHAEPFEAGEIDAHPDADRIWATIEQVKREMADDLDQRDFLMEEDY